MLADHKKNHAQVTRFCDKSLEISTWKIYGNLIKCKIWITLVNISPWQFLFQPFVTWLQENYDYRNVSWEMICIYDLTMSKMRGGERNTCSFQSPWVTLPLNLFFPTHFVLFPSALIWAVDGTVCPAEYALYRLPCDLYVVYVCK